MRHHFHFIGIGGIGMSGLAHMLLKQHYPVSGSDIANSAVVEGLVKAGANITIGHKVENIKPGMTIVYTSDIKKDNVEFLQAKKLGCLLWHRSDMLAKLMEKQKSIAVAGTHGKTTTTSVLSSVLIEAGWDPTIVVGGILSQYGCHSKLGTGEYFVFEADESDQTFLKYYPYGAIVTNIDNDHLNNYQGSEQLLIDAFVKFMSQVTSHDHLLWCADNPQLANLKFPGQSYGFSPSSTWKISHAKQQGFHVVFDLTYKNEKYKEIESALIGHHNVLNCAAVFGLAIMLGIAEKDIRLALKNFKGVLRRCEKKGEKNGILFLDDYAHHPTEIETTLKGMRQAIGDKRMVVVFQPHRYSRTKDCIGMYGSIFNAADHLLVTDIFASNEEPIVGLHAGLIIDEIKAASDISCAFVERMQLSYQLQLLIRPNDVVITLGAGDVTKVASETLALMDT